MNYIKVINAFYDHQEFNPLTSAAINLWHSLMHVNNKSRWKKEFTASMIVLCVKSNLSESSIRKAREELVEKGYVTFTSRSGNQAPIYSINPLYEETDKENDNVEENSGGKSNALIKQNERKRRRSSRKARGKSSSFLREQHRDIVTFHRRKNHPVV